MKMKERIEKLKDLCSYQNEIIEAQQKIMVIQDDLNSSGTDE